MKAMRLAVLGAVATASGCAYESAYYSSTTAYPSNQGDPSNQAAAPPVSSYSVPPTNPKGSVHVISLGVERLPVAAGQPDSYLHLRIAAENKSDDAAWTVDPNEQALAAGGGTMQPAFAEASGGGPVLTLAKGAQGYLDVFYPAPPAGGANRVTLSWKLRRGNEVVPGSTDFDRIATPDPVYSRYEPVHGPHVHVGVGLGWWWPDYYWGWGWGGPWWGSPWWGYPRYYGFYGRGYYGGYYGRGYYGGYYGSGRGYGGGRTYAPSSGTWRGGGSGSATGGAPSSGGNQGRSAPSPGSWRRGR